MKRFITIAILVYGFYSAASPTEQVAKKFREQSTWVPTEISGGEFAATLPGYKDNQGNFFLDSFSVEIHPSVELRVPKTNPNYEEFLYLCSGAENRRALLSEYRERKKGNQFRLSLRTLPSLEQFENNPYSRLTFDSYTVEVEYQSDSIMSQSFKEREGKTMVLERLQNQMTQGKEVGVYNFNLDNLDDFACDLLQKKAKIKVHQYFLSKGPLLEQIEVLPFKDLKVIYDSWSSMLSKVPNERERAFLAGVSLQHLESTGEVGPLQTRTGLQLLSELVPKGNGRAQKSDKKNLALVYDRLQDYQEAIQKHFTYLEIEVSNGPGLLGGEQ